MSSANRRKLANWDFVSSVSKQDVIETLSNKALPTPAPVLVTTREVNVEALKPWSAVSNR